MRPGLTNPGLTIQEIAELKKYARRQGDHQELNRLNGLLIEASREAYRKAADSLTEDIFAEAYELLEELEDEIDSDDVPRAQLRGTMREVWSAMEELRSKYNDSLYD